MKSTWLLLLGVAVGALGSGTYFANSQKRATDPNQASQEPLTGWTKPSPKPKTLFSERLTERHGGSINSAQAAAEATPDRTPAVAAQPATRPVASRPQAPRTTIPSSEPSQAELEIAADRIQNRANRELARLTRLLDLSEAQQDRIFPLLARSSTAYHPALAIQVGDAQSTTPVEIASKTDDSTGAAAAPAEGSAPETSEPITLTTADEEIYDVLTPEQQEALEEEIIDEDLWWTDIVNDLEDELDESAAVPSEEDTGYQGNTGIGNLLQQAADGGTE